MREYGQVQSAWWSHPDTRALDRDAKLIALYLMTGPHSNGLGCFYCPLGYVATDLNIPIETVSKGFLRLAETGFALHCAVSQWVVLPKYLKWNQVANSNVAKARVEEFRAIPSQFSYLSDVAGGCLRYCDRWPEQFRVRLETVSRTVPETVTQTVCQPRPDQTRPDPDPTRPVAPGSEHPAPPSADKPVAKRAVNGEPSASALTWNAYADAYLARYGVPPTRNKAVNGQLAQFVQRVPAAEAPAVAVHYVMSDNAYYLRSRHAVGPMLKDAEGLRTDWLRGATTTDHDSRRADKVAAGKQAVREAEEMLAKHRLHGGSRS